MRSLSQRFDVRRVKVNYARINFDLRVDPTQTICRRDRFRHSIGGILLIEQHLPLKIRQLDDVAIDNPEKSNARPHQLLGDHAAQRTASDEQDPRARQPRLAGVADGGKQGLTVVAGDTHANAN